MCDKLVFDLAQEVEGTPNIFVRKDWINILDNQNQNYNNNQSVLDTSQLSNSNKYMSYREAYFLIPLTLTLGAIQTIAVAPAVGDLVGNPGVTVGFFPNTNTLTDINYGATGAIGLKNWFGQIIHSFTLDYNGTTIIQQTPFVNMWNSFKLMTSFSYQDVLTQGPTIGFFPDDALAFGFCDPNTVFPANGNGTFNNVNYVTTAAAPGLIDTPSQFRLFFGNEGMTQRQRYITFEPTKLCTQQVDVAGPGNAYIQTYGSLLNSGAPGNAGGPGTGASASLQLLWKSYVYNKQNSIAANNSGLIQMAVTATVYLKHIHSFFNMCPLLKGAFMKMTMNLNNTTTEFYTVTSYVNGALPNGNNNLDTPMILSAGAVNNPLGGVHPGMTASAIYNVGPLIASGGYSLFAGQSGINNANGSFSIKYRYAVSVGGRCLDQQLSQVGGQSDSPLAKSVYLYIPAYTFNPVFEQAYLSSPVKQIKYTDIYQYQVLNVAPGNMINNLLTNGIANVKSVLILPFYSTNINNVPINNPVIGAGPLSANTGFLQGVPVWQSPFDPAGTGPTSPLCHLTNFNIQVSGQNAIYNLQKYSFEQFNNQLYGVNAVNGGQTDGLTSSLINRQNFDMEYCYYYVNIERMLPVEMTVPKSIQLIGQNLSSKGIDLICFIEYGNEISIDCLTGARV